MAEFAKVAVVGISLLIFLLILFGGGIQVSPGGSGSIGGPGFTFVPSGTSIGGVVVPTTGPQDTFSVGNTQVEESSHNLLSDDYTITPARVTLADFKNVRIENGVFAYSDQRKDFRLSSDDLKILSEGYISGSVNNTNLYGDLVFNLNGKAGFSALVKAGATFEGVVDSKIFGEENTFVVAATSSGWRTWAPTVYILDAKLEARFPGRASQSINFTVTADKIPSSLGRVVLNLQRLEGIGNLTAIINGVRVYNATPSTRQFIDFNGSLLRSGANVLELTASEGTKFLATETDIIVFWKKQADVTVTQTVRLSSSEVAQLPGEIKFRIEKIFGTPSSLSLRIVSADGKTTNILVSGVLKEGQLVSVPIKDEFSAGSNRVTFLVGGQGSFRLSGYRVIL